MNVYLNYHRPCGFAREKTDAKGRCRKLYDTYLIPFEKLKSLPRWERSLRRGVTAADLERVAGESSDTEFVTSRPAFGTGRRVTSLNCDRKERLLWRNEFPHAYRVGPSSLVRVMHDRGGSLVIHENLISEPVSPRDRVANPKSAPALHSDSPLINTEKRDIATRHQNRDRFLSDGLPFRIHQLNLVLSGDLSTRSPVGHSLVEVFIDFF